MNPLMPPHPQRPQAAASAPASCISRAFVYFFRCEFVIAYADNLAVSILMNYTTRKSCPARFFISFMMGYKPGLFSRLPHIHPVVIPERRKEVVHQMTAAGIDIHTIKSAVKAALVYLSHNLFNLA
jgi:hypothetical protein